MWDSAGGREVNTTTVMAAITVGMGMKFVSSLKKTRGISGGRGGGGGEIEGRTQEESQKPALSRLRGIR